MCFVRTRLEHHRRQSALTRAACVRRQASLEGRTAPQACAVPLHSTLRAPSCREARALPDCPHRRLAHLPSCLFRRSRASLAMGSPTDSSPQTISIPAPADIAYASNAKASNAMSRRLPPRVSICTCVFITFAILRASRRPHARPCDCASGRTERTTPRI